MELSREPPPPLAGGYRPGDELYYTHGGLVTTEGGRFRLEHASRGEVVGHRDRGICSVASIGRVAHYCY